MKTRQGKLNDAKQENDKHFIDTTIKNESDMKDTRVVIQKTNSRKKCHNEYNLTKNEYLIYLYKNLMIGKCDTFSLVRYVLLSLPGLTLEEKQKILKEGPELDKYSLRKDVNLYAYSRLVQYEYCDMCKSFETDMPLERWEHGLYESRLLSPDLSCEEDSKNHTLLFTDEIDLK